MKYKILCIDDTPKESIIVKDKNEHIIINTVLDHEIQKLFSTRYDVVFITNPEDAYTEIKNDPSIKLILLDIMFGGFAEGPLIAETIEAINKDIPIIVLTKETFHGGKGGRQLVYMDNTWKYIEKRKFADPVTQEKIFNLAEALITDPWNKNWLLDTDFYYEKIEGTLKLRNIVNGYETKSFKIPKKIRAMTLHIFEYLLDSPRVPFNLDNFPADLKKTIGSMELPCDLAKGKKGQQTQTTELATVIYELNNKIQKVTNWRTWGILDVKGCERNEVRLMVETDPEILSKQVSTSDTSTDEFKALKEEVNDLKARLESVELLLKQLPSQ